MPKIKSKPPESPNKAPQTTNLEPPFANLSMANRYKESYILMFNKADEKTKKAIQLGYRPEIDNFVKEVIKLAESFDEKPVDKEIKKG